MESLRVVPLAMQDYVTEEIWITLLSLIQRGHSVSFIFSPSHCGIPRNEAADEQAMIARSLPQEGGPIWHVDFLAAVRWPYWRDAQKKRKGAYTALQAPVGVARTLFLARPGQRAMSGGSAQRHGAIPAHSSTGLRVPFVSQVTLCVGGDVPPSLRRPARRCLRQNLFPT
ncbi:hypothetical protein C3747_67g289 [Trypanosoma cruzi]|uniref:Uncharacterized protein n=1 Tax=Trypanosoma cruzi TaxID=5693 RepID=A0A2V2WVV0_TRYCR|nr:hypothetical protein C3747_67g289 [Trypanosoma cruzi]